MDFYPASDAEKKAFIEKNWKGVAAAMQQDARTASGPEPVQPSLIRRLPVWIKAAAVIAGISMAAALVFRAVHLSGKQYATMPQVIAKNGRKIQQVLPDGSSIWLNAGSSLTYAAGYGKSNREVFLQGEAYFDVAPDKDLPFLVHAGRLTVKVLGTSFNVRAYKEEANIETALIKGKVEVQVDDEAEKKIVLLPNEKLTIPRQPVADSLASAKMNEPQVKYAVQALSKQNDSAGYNEIAWINNRLVFLNEPFDVVAQKMERWYDVRIHFLRQSLAQEVLSGIFQKETIDQALQVMQMTTSFSFRRDGKDIYLK